MSSIRVCAFVLASAATQLSAQELPPLLPSASPLPVAQVELLDQKQVDHDAIAGALSSAENFGTELPELVAAVATAKTLDQQPSDLKARVEAEIVRYVRPLPGAQLEENLAAYTALAALEPANAEYASKRDAYAAKKEERRGAILTRYKKNTDEFNGITFYTHKSQPRYTDIRPYVSMYVGKAEGRSPALHFVLNYTTDDGWLFVESAQANIDGDIIWIPGSDWKRDNDTETWEWIDVIASDDYVSIAKKIANSKKTVIRFNGHEFFDNYIVRPEDKEVIRDTLLAYEVLGGRLP